LTTPEDPPGSIEAARRRLERMNAELQRRGEDETIRRTVVNVVIDRTWSGFVKRLLCRIPELPGELALARGAARRPRPVGGAVPTAGGSAVVREEMAAK
jgi:hypothetical protein